METTRIQYVIRVVREGGRTFIESRARVLGEGTSALPRGKILVARTPILSPGASDEELSRATETRILDDEESGSWVCPRCQEEKAESVAWVESGAGAADGAGLLESQVYGKRHGTPRRDPPRSTALSG